MNENQRPREPLEKTQAALLFLLNKYAGSPNRGIASAIVMQLEEILTHPHIDLFPDIHRQCANSVNCWKVRASRETRIAESAHIVH